MRKHYFTWLFLLIGVAHASAQITISAARQAAVGTSVTVTGTITNGPELGQIRYIQDGTAGIAAYFQAGQLSANPVFKGDSVSVTGILKQFNNLLEFDPISSYTIISRGRPEPAPVTVTAANAAQVYAEAYEGMLVKITGLTSVTTSSGQTATVFSGNTNYRLNGDAALIARISTGSTGDTGLVGKPVPSGAFDIVGIMSQFCSSAGCTTGYQLLPRLVTDVQAGPAPNIITRLNVDEINQTSLKLSFGTQNTGDTRLVYGTTPALGQQIADVALVTDHSLTLTGLTPGTVYYVRAISRNANGTSTSPIFAFATESASTGTIKTFFTRSIEPGVALPGNPANYSQDAIDDSIAAYINRATTTLDISIYNFGVTGGNAGIVTAINNAVARGVQVRLMADGGNANTSLTALNGSVRVLKSPQGTNPTGGFYGLMHNKFIVIDAESADPNRVWLWTGATNWTNDQLTSDFNNAILFQDQAIARAYKVEFEEMWGSNTATPGAIYNGTTGTARFGSNKSDNTPHELKIGGKRVELYFSPTDQTNSMIIKSIRSANVSFQFAANTFTRSDLAFAIRDMIDSLGANNCARGLMDDTGSTEERNTYGIMKSRMGTNLRVHSRPGMLHHKYLIVDQDAPTSDPMVLTGSHNWSNAADQRNDENTVIVHDQAVANQYYQEFAARYIEVGGSVCGFTGTRSGLGTSWQVFPNPARETVKIQGIKVVKAKLIDAMGRSHSSPVMTQGTEATISLEGMAKGMYLIQAYDGQNWHSAKISVE